MPQKRRQRSKRKLENLKRNDDKTKRRKNMNGKKSVREWTAQTEKKKQKKQEANTISGAKMAAKINGR